jgi:hypothetical protein
MLSKHAGKCRIGKKADEVAECAVSLEADKAEVRAAIFKVVPRAVKAGRIVLMHSKAEKDWECAAIFKVVPDAVSVCGVAVIAGKIVLMHSKAEEDGECVVILEADKAETLSSKVAADEVVTLGLKNKAVT